MGGGGGRPTPSLTPWPRPQALDVTVPQSQPSPALHPPMPLGFRATVDWRGSAISVGNGMLSQMAPRGQALSGGACCGSDGTSHFYFVVCFGCR